MGQFAVPLAIAIDTYSFLTGVGTGATAVLSLVLATRAVVAACSLAIAFKSPLAPVAVFVFELVAWLCPGRFPYLFDFYGTLGSVLAQRATAHRH